MAMLVHLLIHILAMLMNLSLTALSTCHTGHITMKGSLLREDNVSLSFVDTFLCSGLSKYFLPYLTSDLTHLLCDSGDEFQHTHQSVQFLGRDSTYVVSAVDVRHIRHTA